MSTCAVPLSSRPVSLSLLVFLSVCLFFSLPDQVSSTMLVKALLQTSLVLWLAQYTLQGGVKPQSGGMGKMLPRGAGALGIQGGYGAKPAKTGGAGGGRYPGGAQQLGGGEFLKERGDTEAQEGPGVGEDMVTEAREAMVLVWEQEMAKEWGREPDWAHRVGNHVEDTVVMDMAHSQVTGLELEPEPEAIHDQVLELGIPMDRDLRDQNRDMVQELECPMDRVLNPMGMLQELEEFPLDRVLNHPNRDMVQELECPMDRVLNPMDMVQELAFPMVRVLNPMDMVQELEPSTVVKAMDMVQEWENPMDRVLKQQKLATVLEQAATLGQETTAMEQVLDKEDTPRMEQVPVWDREDTPRVEQEDTPRVEQEDTPRVEQVDTHRVEKVDTPRVEQVDTHRVEKVDTPRVEQVDTPRVEQEDTPRVEQEDTPRVEQVDTPRVEQVDTPRVEQVDTPRVEQVDTPRVEQVDTPRVQENQAKLAVVLIWDREDIPRVEQEDIPRVEQEDTPRVEQANQRVMVIKLEEHTPGPERATDMGMVEAQLGGPMQCLQAMAMATVLVLEAMVMEPGEESVSFLTMEPQSILLDWMQVMEASLMVLSNWALVVMEANPLANMATVDCHRVHNRVHSLMDLRLVVGNHLAKMETEGALEHSQQAMVKDSWVQVRVPPTVTEQEGRKANMVVVD
ncbi:titin-like [Oncorhynchus keta]|uniref:titin-like n=1 Tax=Oncorhynchus keta TaxID=8018 RepID=UPI00227B5BB0|nr:titin-like [Oncorhynchus keta]